MAGRVRYAFIAAEVLQRSETTRCANCGLACCIEAALLAIVVDGANHCVTQTRTDVATGEASSARTARRPRAPEHPQSICIGIIELEHLRHGERAKGHQDEIGQQRKQDQMGIAQRFNDLGW
jgi:hypothetical protein